MLRAAHGIDDVLGAEHGAHRAGAVDGDIGDVQIARWRGQHHRDYPRIARDTAHAAHVADIEEPPEILAQPLRDALPDRFTTHTTSINQTRPPREKSPF